MWRKRRKKKRPDQTRLWVNGKEVKDLLLIEVLDHPPHSECSRIACVWTSEPRREIVEIRSFGPFHDSDYGFRSVCSVCGEPIQKGACCWREFSKLAPPPCSDVNPHFGRLYHDTCVVEITLDDLDDPQTFRACSLKQASVIDLEELRQAH